MWKNYLPQLALMGNSGMKYFHTLTTINTKSVNLLVICVSINALHKDMAIILPFTIASNFQCALSHVSSTIV